jgi:hypothetical protein
VNELANAYLRQAQSDLQVFKLLAAQDRTDVPDCHPLHYLQMATEKLAKAAMLALEVEGLDRFSHVAFSQLSHQLKRPDMARKLGHQNFRAYRHFLIKATPFFRQIEELNPAVGTSHEGGGSKEGPNVEYPWPGRDLQGKRTWHIPSRHQFRLLSQLREDRDAVGILPFVERLMERFDAVFM